MFSGKRYAVFNELENNFKLKVINNSLKCYSSVTFGVQNVSATNPVTVRVHRRFSFNYFQVMINYTISINGCQVGIATERFSFRFLVHIFHRCEYLQKSRSRVKCHATSAILHLKINLFLR